MPKRQHDGTENQDDKTARQQSYNHKNLLVEHSQVTRVYESLGKEDGKLVLAPTKYTPRKPKQQIAGILNDFDKRDIDGRSDHTVLSEQSNDSSVCPSVTKCFEEGHRGRDHDIAPQRPRRRRSPSPY